MSSPKTTIPYDLKRKCHKAIHIATAASATAGAAPIPMSDAVPITAAQIAMIVSLGKIFGLTLSDSAAKSLLGVGAAQQAGRAVASNIMKAIPGAGTVVGGIVGATTAAALTETLGWLVAEDFYRMSQGKEPNRIIENASELKGAFEGLRMSGKSNC